MALCHSEDDGGAGKKHSVIYNSFISVLSRLNNGSEDGVVSFFYVPTYIAKK